jgi:5-methylcytosine-specific restriction endonuclease McrA
MIGTRTGTGMPKIALNCIYCQKEFSVRPCYKNHKYCSRKCYANSRFNPNRTDMDRWERKRFRNTVKQQVLLRDGYRCTMCGLSNNLQVDHIQPWSDYVELRFSMDNCRTLCQKCHYEITFGREMPSNITYWGQNSMKGELNA